MKNKIGKKILIIIVSIVVIGIILIVYYNNQNKLSNDDLLKILEPQLDIYCNNIQENATLNDPNNCATCYFKFRESIIVENFSVPTDYGITKYIIKKINEDYLIEIQLPVIYGRNDKPGTLNLFVKLNKKGNVIEKTFPETC